MAKQSIGVGSASNDGTGDTLRQGAFKVNSNFNEIYSIFGDANNLVSFAKTSGISSDSNKLGGQSASFYTNLDNLTSGSLDNDQLPSTISGKTFVGNLTGNVIGNVTGSLTGTATSSVRSSLAYGLTATPSITVNEITAVTLTGNVIGDITGSAGYATTAGLANYAFLAGLSTDSQRSVYSQLAGVSTISGYATTAGIATLAVNAQGLTGSPNVNVGFITATQFLGDGSQLTGVVAASSGILIKDSDNSIGIAATVNFGFGATVSPLSAGIVTITSSTPGIDTSAISEFNKVIVSGISSLNGQILGIQTDNVIPFYYDQYGQFPSASTYHGAFAHAHDTGRAYFAHAGWKELVNKEASGVVGTGTEVYNIGDLTVTGNVSIAGTLTYEDVTNVDSVGLITARSGIVATGVVTATSFSGPLTGNADTATAAGTATTATRSNSIAVSDESTDVTCSVLYTNEGTGYQAAKSGTNLTFDAVTGTLKPTNINATGIITASSFSGNATSATTASTADVATKVTVTDQSGDTSCSLLFAQAATGDVTPHTGSNLTFNSSTGQLYATQFTGSGAGLSNIPPSAITGGIDSRPNFQTTEYTTRTSFNFSGSFTSVPSMSCTITPSNSNSKILVHVLVMGETQQGVYDTIWALRRSISGGSSNDLVYPGDSNRQGTLYCSLSTTINFEMHPYQFWYVDTPGTTNAVTYTPRIKSAGGSQTFFINRDRGYYNYATYRVSGSRITLTEVQP